MANSALPAACLNLFSKCSRKEAFAFRPTAWARFPRNLLRNFPAGSIRLNARVEALHENELTLAGGEILRARAIVVAADGPSAAHLVGEVEPASRSVTCFYYSADEPPVARLPSWS